MPTNMVDVDTDIDLNCKKVLKPLHNLEKGRNMVSI